MHDDPRPDSIPAAAEERSAREAFESVMRLKPLVRRENGEYMSQYTQEDWELWLVAWQARAALAAPKAEAWQQELQVYDARGRAFNIMQAQQRDGSTRWKVSDGIAVLNIHGDWEFEPSPSTRDDGFLARCRFDSPQAALAVLKCSLAPTSPAPQEESK